MSIEAMKEALEAIETYGFDYMHGMPKKHYTKLLRKAIEEAEKREWVGLTDEDIWQLRREGANEVSDKDFKAIEAKLREKNT